MNNIHKPSAIFLFLLFGFLSILLGFGQTSALAKAYSIEVETGLGYDDNIFRSSDTSYLDPFAPKELDGTTGTTVPKVQSGLFVPYKLKAESKIKLSRFPWLKKVKLNKWTSKFKLTGRKYLDSDFENADDYKVSLKTGLEFLLKKLKKKKYTFYIGPIAEQKNKTYYDRDTGKEKLTNSGEQDGVPLGLPIGERYNYLFYGLETELSIRTTLLEYAITAETRTYDYKSTAFDQFDHQRYRIGAEVSVQIIRPTKLTIGYDYFIRDYDVWIARRKVDGKKVAIPRVDQVTPNPTREYTFHELDVSLKNRLSPLWAVYLDYNYQTRTDEFQGYSNFTRNVYKLRAIYNDKQQRRLKVSVAYWTRKHPNTFAFDNKNFPKTKYDALEFKLSGEMPLYRQWVLWGEIDSIQQDTTDPRYEYDRNQGIVGVKIEF